MKTKTKLSRDVPTSFDELSSILPLRPVRDDAALENAQALADRLAILDERTDDQEAYLETLSILIEKYEDDQHAIDTEGLDALGNLQLLMEQHEMNASDLGRLLGQRQLGAKILRRERALSKAHIETLAAHFAVSPAAFLRA